MKKEYQSVSVYDALQERLEYIFQEFDNIYVSFSGGKDSGLLLNLVMDFKRKYYPDRIVGVFHQDFEAQYTLTTQYIERTFQNLWPETKNLYWVCPVSYTHLDVYKRQVRYSKTLQNKGGNAVWSTSSRFK